MSDTTEPEIRELTERILSVYLHNGFNVVVQGNDKAIDVLKDLLIPNKEVKGLVIYTAEPEITLRNKVESWNYTRLKELRA